MKRIKVQILGLTTAKAYVESLGNPDIPNDPVTFIAYSDTIKARVLEMLIDKSKKVGVSFTNQEQSTGEWHESFVPDALFNDQTLNISLIDTGSLASEFINRLESIRASDCIKEEQRAQLLFMLGE